MRVLVLNAGSSSLKVSVVEAATRTTIARSDVAWGDDATRADDRDEAVRRALGAAEAAGVEFGTLDAVGHRVVHGGARFIEPTSINADTVGVVDELRDLAPLHNGVAAAAISAARKTLPDVPHVAVFDTAFHRTLPEEEVVIPLPWAWYTDHGIRRFGFHGLSVAWASLRAGELLRRPSAELGLVVAHLGSGCSVTAVRAGRSVATSMGMTPLEGLMMGTRSGSVDPGVLVAAIRDGLVADHEALAEALTHDSGLLGVSGVSGEMRLVREAAEAGDARATLARTMFMSRTAAAIAAAATALRRLDGVVFTGGIGEHDQGIRAGVLSRLVAIGVRELRTEGGGAEPIGEDAILSGPGDPVAVLRVVAREDLVIGHEVERLLRH